MSDDIVAELYRRRSMEDDLAHMNEAVGVAETLRDENAFDWDEVDTWRVTTAIWQACNAARAEQRERDAQIADESATMFRSSVASRIAAAIRNRGDKT